MKEDTMKKLEKSLESLSDEIKEIKKSNEELMRVKLNQLANGNVRWEVSVRASDKDALKSRLTDVLEEAEKQAGARNENA